MTTKRQHIDVEKNYITICSHCQHKNGVIGKKCDFFSKYAVLTGFMSGQVLTNLSDCATIVTWIGDGTHNKKRNSRTQYRKSMKEGKTPMEKNVTVVDEQGHVYGATYPKRAKGLVKNGRARFVDENTICLACPPNQILEDTEMSENINITKNTNENAVLTEKEIFDQIVLLQKQLTEQSYTSLYRLGEALSNARGEGEDVPLSDEQVSNVCAVFAQREETLNQMLRMYQQMYDNLQQERLKSTPLSEDEKRKQYLDFVVQATESVPGPEYQLPDFDHIWKTVYLGQ